MNRRAFLAGSFGLGVTALVGQMPLPPRTRIRNPYYTETYEHNAYDIGFSFIQAGREIRYLAVRIMPVSASLAYPQNVLAILIDAGLVEPNTDGLKAVEFTNSGAIFRILSLGRKKSMRVEGGFLYRKESWLNIPPPIPVDLFSLPKPATVLITLGGVSPSSPPLPAILLD